MFRITYINRKNLAKLIEILKSIHQIIIMLRFCFSGGFRRFLPITLEEVSIMSRYHQQRNIRTTIPSFYLYREISKIMEDESIGIKSSTRVVTRADCVCESLKDVVDLREILDCCPFRQKDLNDKLANGEVCRLCQVEDAEIPEILLELAWQVFFDWQDRLYEFDEDYYEVTQETAELAQAAVSLSLKKFALANGIKLTTPEELKNFANFFFNSQLRCYWKGAECVYIDYYSGYIDHIRLLIYELPKLALDANDIEDFKKWMEFVQKNPQQLQEKDEQMALMIEKKRGRAEAKDQKKKL